MSLQSGTLTDLIYTSLAAGVPFTSAGGANIEPQSGTNPAPALNPLVHFQLPYGEGKTFEWMAAGVVSTAAAAPGTLTLSFAIGPAATVLVAASAFTPAVSLSNGYWQMRGFTTLQSVGSAGQWLSHGTLKMANSATATADMIEYQMPANTAVASWLVTYDTTQVTVAGAYGLHVRATWSTAPAGDSITCAEFKIMGWN